MRHLFGVTRGKKMGQIVKAKVKPFKRRASAVCITIVGLFVCFAIFMACYTFAGDMTKKAVYGTGYVIAAILGAVYIIMRINTMYATYISCDGENISMCSWDNDFLPYNTDGSVKLISSFVPAKTKHMEFPVRDITAVYIGTKNFIKRNAKTNEDFLKNVRDFERSKDRYEKKQVQSMDIIYIELANGTSRHMPIVDYDANTVKKILKMIIRKNPDAEIKTGSREYRLTRVSDSKE